MNNPEHCDCSFDRADSNSVDNTDDVTTTLDNEPPQVIGIDSIPASDDGDLVDVMRSCNLSAVCG